jgi:hypothetical protein
VQAPSTIGFPLHAKLFAALLLFGLLFAGCITVEKSIIECATNDECEVDETCIDDICLPCSAIADRQRRLFPGCDTDEVLCEAQSACGVTLRCVNTSSDLDHCGACNQACPLGGPNTDMLCSSSTCLYACESGFLDIDGRPGCEYECSVSGETTAELCDGLDNDCNGLTDADDARFVAPACPNGTGVCALALAQCLSGGAVECSPTQVTGSLPADAPAYEPNVELACDFADNDCDGLVDEPCCSPARADALELSQGPASDEAWNASGLTFTTVGAVDRLTWTSVGLATPRRVDLERARLCREAGEVPVRVLGRVGDAESVLLCRQGTTTSFYPLEGGAPAFVTDDVILAASVSAADGLRLLTVRTEARAERTDHLVTWRDTADRETSTPFEERTLPVFAASLGRVGAVLVPNTTEPNVVAHILADDGTETGERVSLIDEADGLVLGAPILLASAPPGRRFLAFSSGNAGREVFAKPLGQAWQDAQPQARSLGRADSPILALRVVPADEGIGVIARTEQEWLAWLVEPLTGDVLEERVVRVGDLSPTVAGEEMWRAAWSARVLIVAMVDEGDEWEVARFGTTGDRVCSTAQ